MSEDIALDCYVEYMRDDSDDAHGDFLRIVGKAIADAREEGRAAGYAEAIEQAAKVAEAEYDRLYRSHRDADLPGMEAARSIENAIRALAPADKEPK